MGKKRYNLSNYQLLTGNMGMIYPIGIQEVLPGDVFRHSTSAMIRLSPMAAPVMHPMQIRVHHYFVPHRLVWDGFEDFITGGEDGMNADSPPTFTPDYSGSIPCQGEYLGLPEGMEVSALPMYGYNLIYNEYYRDQDLIPEIANTNQTVRACAWEKDYFTTCRPWESKGPDVTLPLGISAPISGLGVARGTDFVGTGIQVTETQGDATYPFGRSFSAGDELMMRSTGFQGLPDLYADLENATAVSVNALKRAFALERFQEARAQYGSRYSEYLRYYGVRPSDARLDRPEYLGGGKVRINVSEVLQTAPETSADPIGSEYGVGDLYGHGIGGLRTNAYRRAFPEHGYVHSLISIRPKAMYSDQVPRTFLKKDRFDFFTKEMQHVGQQQVWKGELGNTSAPYETFGYQDRYREYTSSPSQIHGEFKNLLDYWHLARQFQSDPALNAAFITCDPSKRIFNVQTHDVLWMMVQHHISALRPVQHSSMGKII